MHDLYIIAVFALGAAFGIVATLIYWPWVEPNILPDDEARDD